MRISMTVLALAAACAITANAQPTEHFPNHPIRLIIATPAGSTPDIGARIAAQQMSVDLKQAVVVENKPGANGLIAVREVLKNPHDGYTLLVAPQSTMSINPHVYKAGAEEALTQFTAVGQLYQTDFSLIVRPNAGIDTIADLVREAKARPGKLVAAYAAPGSASHVAIELFKQRAGVDIYTVPFNSSPAASLAVAGGNADMLFESIASTDSVVKSGKANRIAMTGKTRFSLLPAVPTISESGVKDFSMTTWAGVFAPKNVPESRVRRLSTSLAIALKSPELIASLQSSGLLVGDPSLRNFESFWQAETAMWKQTVEASPALRIGQ